jgi:hypothetical protein
MSLFFNATIGPQHARPVDLGHVGRQAIKLTLPLGLLF